MKYSEHAINVMTARTFKGVGRAWIVNNLSSKKTDNEIVNLLNFSTRVRAVITVNDFKKKKTTVRKIIYESKGVIDGVVELVDEKFPQHYGSVKNSEKPDYMY